MVTRIVPTVQRFLDRYWRIAFWSMLWLILGILLTNTFIFFATGTNNTSCPKDKLTSQQLGCDDYATAANSIRSLDAQFDAAIPQYIHAKKVTRASVWVRNLTSMQWASTNENDTYAPASLMKLPLMISYFKVAEIEPSLLKTTLVFEPSSALNSSTQDFAPQQKLVPGQTYTVEQLIEHMIIYSDNDAEAVLADHLDPTIFNQTLVDLGIKIPQNNSTVDFVTPKTYAGIFRTLYNSSYLSRDDSEKVLELLSKSTFTGLADPLPQGTVVAHKFGEREVDSYGSVATRELHDCGIVYKSDRPYSICIMTAGTNWNDMLSVIHDLSEMAYKAL
jgi:beta-lactamase class A